jgi:preprotein translocase subunit SecE
VRKEASAADEEPATASAAKSAGPEPKRKLTKAPVRKERSHHRKYCPSSSPLGHLTLRNSATDCLVKVTGPMRCLPFVLLIIAYVSGLDVVFGWVVIKLFGH